MKDIFVYLIKKTFFRLIFPKTRKISSDWMQLLKEMLVKDPKKRIKIKFLFMILSSFTKETIEKSANCLGLMRIYLI